MQALVDTIMQPFRRGDAGAQPPADTAQRYGSEGYFDPNRNRHDLRKERAAPRQAGPKVETSHKLSELQKEPIGSARERAFERSLFSSTIDEAFGSKPYARLSPIAAPASQVSSPISKVKPISQVSSATVAPTSQVLSATVASTSEMSKRVQDYDYPVEFKTILSSSGDDLVGETCEMKSRRGQWQAVLVTCRNPDGTYAVVLHGDLSSKFPSVAAKDLREVSKDLKVSRTVRANGSSNGRSQPEVFGGRLANRLEPGSSSKFRDLVHEIDWSLGSIAEALPPNAMSQLQAAANERRNPILKGASPFSTAEAARAKMSQTSIIESI